MSAVRKLKPKPQPRVFHATVLVTRAEEWWVEADTAEEARALFASDRGHLRRSANASMSSWKSCSRTSNIGAQTAVRQASQLAAANSS
jgi:hypothetical protein